MPSLQLSTIHAHFDRVDPIIAPMVRRLNRTPLPLRSKIKPDQFFVKLCGEIIGQQLSGKVADVIEGRFWDLFPDREPTPRRVLKLTTEKLRSVGLSGAKTRYIQDLAKHVAEKKLPLATLPTLADEAVIETLTAVKGIGRWTAEMFLLFTLGRPDIFSFNDLGLRKGLEKLYGLNVKAKPLEIEPIVNKWTPFRSYGSLALWQSLDSEK